MQPVLVPIEAWRRAWFGSTPSHRIARVVFQCPCCFREMMLGSAHHVRDGGLIVPSLQCPWPRCRARLDVQLEGWDPDITAVDRVAAPSIPPLAGTDI